MVAKILFAFAVAVAPVSYVPPVDAPIVDGFRPPADEYGAGNRGIDYDTAPGDDVRAAAPGVVTFAGRIGAASHVVVLHDDGIRTSYSFLDTVTVARGDRVGQGDVVGTAQDDLHFGARAGEEYLDPTALLGDGPPRVQLVPTDLDEPPAEWQERRGLIDSLTGALSRTTRAALTPVARLARTYGWEPTRAALRRASDDLDRMDATLRALGHVAYAPITARARRDARVTRVLDAQRECTPPTSPTPIAPARNHVLVLVGGRNSSTGHTPLLDIDAAALGYAPDDVIQFSYAGGTPYSSDDTHTDLATAGERLRALLADITRMHPGATVDVIAHSQGGLVARAAMHGSDLWDPAMPVVGNVITIATPHHGALPATTAAALGLPVGGAVQDLSSSSRLIDDLDDRALPAGSRFTSIAASGDLVVDAQLASVAHATNVIVHAEGLHAHDETPRLPATHRELALALAGAGPACRPGSELAEDLVLADTINLANGVRWVADRAEAHLWDAPPGPIHSSAASEGIGSSG